MNSVFSGFGGFLSWYRRIQNNAINLLEEFISHKYFLQLKEFNWSLFRIGQIVTASILINLLELASPLYINIVYTVILPKQAYKSLIVLTTVVVALILLSGAVKAIRLTIIGEDGARIEHTKRVEVVNHFVSLPINEFLKLTPSAHLARLNSINLLKDESALQSLTIAIDLIFSLVFILALIALGGWIAIPVIIGLSIYLYKSLGFAREYEMYSRERDRLEIDRLNFQSNLVDSVELIKSNGLSRKFLVYGESLQESMAWQRMKGNQFLASYQSFGSFVSQSTFAAVATVGGLLVINDHLLVGALAACLILVGKVFNPWQQAMTLWSSYRRLGHSRDEFDKLMSTPTLLSLESQGSELNLKSDFTLTSDKLGEIKINAGSPNLVRDNSYGSNVRDLFVCLTRAQIDDSVKINNLNIDLYKEQDLLHSFAYVNPSHEFFDGSLIQNICLFQPSKGKRTALFWCYLLDIDTKIKGLPNGYDTQLGSLSPTGLSTDDKQLLHIVSALSRKPQVLMIDLNDCSFGKAFVDGLEKIIKRTKGKSTLLFSGNGRILEKLCS